MNLEAGRLIGDAGRVMAVVALLAQSASTWIGGELRSGRERLSSRVLCETGADVMRTNIEGDILIRGLPESMYPGIEMVLPSGSYDLVRCGRMEWNQRELYMAGINVDGDLLEFVLGEVGEEPRAWRYFLDKLEAGEDLRITVNTNTDGEGWRYELVDQYGFEEAVGLVVEKQNMDPLKGLYLPVANIFWMEMGGE